MLLRMDVRDIHIRTSLRPAPYASPGVFVACLHPDACFEMVGPAWELELGFTPLELEGRRLVRRVALEPVQAAARLRCMLDPGTPDPVSLPLRCKDAALAELELFRRFDDYEPSIYFAGGLAPGVVTSLRGRARAGRARS